KGSNPNPPGNATLMVETSPNSLPTAWIEAASALAGGERLVLRKKFFKLRRGWVLKAGVGISSHASRRLLGCLVVPSLHQFGLHPIPGQSPSAQIRASG